MITEYSKYEPIFGAYYIKQELGEGSFGKVYEIERDDFGGKYQAALKAITIPKKRDEIEQLQIQRRNPTEYFKGIAERVVAEIELMSKLKGNSNIVSYENHQVIPHDDGVGWDILIQMELLTPLYKYLYDREYTADDVVQLGIDICHGLEICHANNIIHRDVKPENIFVSKLGRYKLGDFGVAKISEATGSGTKAGTESYMAPEIYNNEKYGASADVYSLGMVMYCLLNDYRLPFEEENVANPYISRVFANSKRMSGAELPDTKHGGGRLEQIVKKACCFNPADRYHSAAELRRDLESLKSQNSERIQHGHEYDDLDTLNVTVYEREIAEDKVTEENGTRDMRSIPMPIVAYIIGLASILMEPVLASITADPWIGNISSSYIPVRLTVLVLSIVIDCAAVWLIYAIARRKNPEVRIKSVINGRANCILVAMIFLVLWRHYGTYCPIEAIPWVEFGTIQIHLPAITFVLLAIWIGVCAIIGQKNKREE